MKNISILGSTGSIGTQALEVIEHGEGLCVCALAAGSNAKAMEQQIRKFRPRVAAMLNEDAARDLKIMTGDTNTRILSGMEGVCAAASEYGADMVLTAMVGSAGIMPTMAAIEAGCGIALANKETMVCAGEIVCAAAKEKGVSIIPVDSEHSAIFQCIGQDREFVKKIILTASGGPFFGKSRDELKNVTANEALRHPNWSMGAKITIDSATLINKGLEVIEAVWLFGVEPEDIEVLVHRQGIVHSMVVFCDHSVIAQMGVADMRIPISYALNFPRREKTPASEVDFLNFALTFEKPDTSTFFGLSLAFEAIMTGGTMPAVYSAANEAAVQLFLEGKCGFLDIARLVKEAMLHHKTVINPDLESILNSDADARRFVFDKCANTI